MVTMEVDNPETSDLQDHAHQDVEVVESTTANAIGEKTSDLSTGAQESSAQETTGPKDGQEMGKTTEEKLSGVSPGSEYRLKMILSGHTRSVSSIKFSPDGTLLASAGEFNLSPSVAVPEA